jgi:hypothetical protein
MSSAVDIRSLSVAETEELLGMPADTVPAHVTRGLPLREDGRVDLVAYAAWLNTDQAKAKGEDADA